MKDKLSVTNKKRIKFSLESLQRFVELKLFMDVKDELPLTSFT